MLDMKELHEKVKFARNHHYITNCYSMDIIDKAEYVWESANGFIFSYEDHGIYRLIFYVSNWDGLAELVQKAKGKKFFFEFMIRDTDVETIFGGTLVTRMLRMANPDCRSVFNEESKVLNYKGTAVVESATERDTVEITKILWKTFRTETSHLLYANELKNIINEGKIKVHRTDGIIDALLQADVLPKKFYINQIVNLGEKKNVHAILLDQLWKYVSSGGKYLYAWVEESNTASIKFHEKYGLQHDGMYSMIYYVEG